MSERPKESCPATSETRRTLSATCATLHSVFTLFLHSFLREKMAQAYDFALDKIGMEIMSYQVCVSQKLDHNLDGFVFFF